MLEIPRQNVRHKQIGILYHEHISPKHCEMQHDIVPTHRVDKGLGLGLEAIDGVC